MAILDKIHTILLKHIKVSNSNVRITDRDAGIEELSKSIKNHGLLQPVVLKGISGNPPYELVVGQRRWRAHKLLKKSEIRAVFCGAMSDIESKILSLSENMQRVQLNYADKAEAITALYKEYSKDDKRVARELGVSVQTVREYVRIEERATPKAKNLLRKRKVRKEDVKRVIEAAQGDAKKADALLDEMPKLSKYEKDRVVRYGRNHPKASAIRIVEGGKKEKHEPSVILNLTPELEEALDRARKVLLMDNEVIAANALSEWLEANGFLKSKA